MKIERAKIEDLPEIKSLNDKYFHEKRDFQEVIKDKDNLFYVGKENGRVIGFSGIHHFKWNNTARIIDIFIVPDFRGRGYGKEFIKKIKAAAKQVKARTIIAEAPSLNSVLSLYLKDGFRICGFNDRYYSNEAKEIAIFLSFDLK